MERMYKAECRECKLTFSGNWKKASTWAQSHAKDNKHYGVILSQDKDVRNENFRSVPVNDFSCGVCGRAFKGSEKYPLKAPFRSPKITGSETDCLVCEDCMDVFRSAGMEGIELTKAYAGTVMPLSSHCFIESGGLKGAQLEEYIKRYYSPM